MDKFIVEGTGTKVAGGYTVKDLKCILKSLINIGMVKIMDFVEFNPRLDVNNTLEICKDILKYISIILYEKI